jgi:hypothetical protein
MANGDSSSKNKLFGLTVFEWSVLIGVLTFVGLRDYHNDNLIVEQQSGREDRKESR